MGFLTSAAVPIASIAALCTIALILFQARKAIIDGRAERAKALAAIRKEGFDAGVASVQPVLLNLRSDLAEMKDSRDYYRGLRGGGTDHRSQGGSS